MCIYLTLVPAFQAMADEPVHGILMVVKGDVKVTSGQSKITEPGKVGKKILPGDSISTGPDSRAKIVMSDKNVLNISPDSQMAIEKYTNDGKDKNVELKVEFGKIRASVEQKYDGEKSKFNVKTPSAVAGVRGTDFLTSYDRGSKKSQIITFSGTVAVGKPGPGGAILNPVFVQPGQTTTASEGKAPESPKAMPKEEMKKANQESSADLAKSSGSGKEGGKDTASKDSGDKKDGKDGGKDDRKPAGDGKSMIDSNDLGTGPKGGGDFAQPGMMGPQMMPTMPKAPPVSNPFLDGAVRGSGSKATIIINKQ
jgi:hypothetical protein